MYKRNYKRAYKKRGYKSLRRAVTAIERPRMKLSMYDQDAWITVQATAPLAMFAAAGGVAQGYSQSRTDNLVTAVPFEYSLFD